MRLSARAAVVGERAFGDDIVGARRHAEVRPAVPDHHVRRQQRPLRVRAFAIGAADAAVALGMRERKAPAITALPFELVGKEGHGKPRAAQDRADDAIEAVGNDLHIRAVSTAELEKGRKAGVDPHGADLLVERLGRRAQQGNLARHAFARGNFSALPSCLDLPPRRVGEAFEQAVRGIVRSDGAVEVDQNTPVWSSVCLACFDGSNPFPLGAVDCRAGRLARKA